MKALIISFFNSSNVGDCVLSNCLLNLFERRFECEKVSYTLQPFSYMDLNDIKPITLNRNAGIKSKIIKTINLSHLYWITEEYYWKKQYLSNNNENKLLELIRKTDIVIIGGGNMIFDLKSGNLSAGRFKYYADLCKKENKPVFACCIGIGPFSNKNQFKKSFEALECSDAISFRDEKSYLLYQKMGGKKGLISTDPAYLLEKSSTDSKTKYLAINIIDPSAFTDEESKIRNIQTKYISLIQLLAKKHNIKVFTTDVRDYEFAKKVTEQTNITPININSVNLLLELLNQASIVIGSRMHSMIIALTQNRPIIGLKWQAKVGEVFKYMQLEQYCHNIDDFDIRIIEKQVKMLQTTDRKRVVKLISKMTEKQKNILNHNIKIAENIIKKHKQLRKEEK